VEDDILIVDVVTETKTAKGKTPLTLASRPVGKFLDVVKSWAIRGVLPSIAGSGGNRQAQKTVATASTASARPLNFRTNNAAPSSDYSETGKLVLLRHADRGE
jgi:hypothetical protein